MRVHQNREKLLRDICQRLLCFFECCKGQIIVHTSEVDGSEPEPVIQDDKKDLWPPSCFAIFLTFMWSNWMGKTTWIVELLKHHEELCTHTPKKLIWICGVEQPDLFETIKKIWFPRQCEFVDGCLVNFVSDQGSLCIFDDVMNEVSSDSMISKLFTRGRSHVGCSLVLMLQNIFPKGIQSRTISINTQYQVLFLNPRDSLQISILARQLCPRNSKDFLEIYKRATQRPYGYLFCCFTQSCPDEIRYRTNVLPNEYPSIVYQL